MLENIIKGRMYVYQYYKHDTEIFPKYRLLINVCVHVMALGIDCMYRLASDTMVDIFKFYYTN